MMPKIMQKTCHCWQDSKYIPWSRKLTEITYFLTIKEHLVGFKFKVTSSNFVEDQTNEIYTLIERICWVPFFNLWLEFNMNFKLVMPMRELHKYRNKYSSFPKNLFLVGGFMICAIILLPPGISSKIFLQYLQQVSSNIMSFTV